MNHCVVDWTSMQNMSALTVTQEAYLPMVMETSHCSFQSSCEAWDFALASEVLLTKLPSHGHGWLTTS